MKTKSFLTLFLLLAMVSGVHATPLGTAFTYQGRLDANGSPANGTYELRFTIFDSASGGRTAAGPLTSPGVAVSNGLFTVQLDFGANVFTGEARWLEIAVHTNDNAAPFVTLSPRQPLTATPYALHALSATLPAGSVKSTHIADGAIAGADLANGSVTTAEIDNGSVLPADLNVAAFSSTFWKVDGNAGTTADTHFVGTTDNQALELRVNGQRAVRFEPTSRSATVNVIGGSPSNQVAAGVAGATMWGGGFDEWVGRTVFNSVEADFTTISGGYDNHVAGRASTIGGGAFNRAEGMAATIAGGWGNKTWAGADLATVCGGSANVAAGDDSFVGGGSGNSANNGLSVVVGGWRNTNHAASGFIGGGDRHYLDVYAAYASIPGGERNWALGRHSVIGGGLSNWVMRSAVQSVIGGGAQNTNYAADGVIVGGSMNSVGIRSVGANIDGGRNNIIEGDAPAATVGGGSGNEIQTFANYATVGGGLQNLIQSSSGSATIGGGFDNTIQPGASSAMIAGGSQNTIQRDSGHATIGGGGVNTIGTNAMNSTIGGGRANQIQTDAWNSTLDGGFANTIERGALSSSIGGGVYNSIRPAASASTIAGGWANKILPNAGFAAIPGGLANDATNHAFAAGTRAKAHHTGAFVWGDSTPADVTSTASNQFTVRASGGVRFFSNPTLSAGVRLVPGGGSWTSLSDRKAKENFDKVNTREVLEKVAGLPVHTWNYKTQDSSIRHMGPTAQDFHTVFGVGESDTGITTIDADGVALAAIQGLNQKLEEKLQQKEAEITKLSKTVADLKQLITQRTRQEKKSAR